MTEQTDLVPKRRFKGFLNSHAWEQRELGELGSVAMNKRIFKEQTAESGEVPFYKIGTFGGNPDAFISRELFEAYKAKYSYPKVGDILISASGSIGRTVEYTGKDEYFQDSNIVWLKHDERLDSSFLKQFYSIVKWQGLEGSTIKRLYNKNILDTRISVPSLSEQKNIGQFFSLLDHLITLHQRKLEKTKALKAAYLSEMFPAEGESEPKRRFVGFTGAWEQRELEKITLKIGSGKTPKGGESSYVLEGIPLLRSQNVYDDLIDLNDVAYITPQTDEEMKNSRVVKNDVLLNITGASIGRTAVYRHSSPANVNQHVCIVRPAEGYSSDFIQLNLTSPKGQQQIDNNQAGGGREGLNFQQIGKMSFAFPSIEEQDQISELLKKLDHLITLHQRKFEKLQNLKKAYLNEMFV
ncbi:restriction endonuclease subunit S [Paenibacillus sp. FSL F4-0243]|uniref:restriction endonuclease subunit S n=1 Tax=Paenibacillus sp. FSL F4-0243 TaxID=2954732 RepID=UPI0030D7A104